MVPFCPCDKITMFGTLINQTKVIKSIINEITGPLSSFASFPSLVKDVYGGKWVNLGDAAVSFDPLCGDGVGYVIKGALLLLGSINGIKAGLPPIDCLDHYSNRLKYALLCHLNVINITFFRFLNRYCGRRN